MNHKSFWQILKSSFHEWRSHDGPRLGAALAYYTVLSLAPLLIIIIAIAGSVFGQQAVEGQIVAQIQGLVGDQGAAAIQAMIRSAHQIGAGALTTILGIGVLLFGASGVFSELRDSLHTIWDVKLERKGVLHTIKSKIFTFGMVVSAGFILLVSLAISALLTAAGDIVGRWLSVPPFVLQSVNILFSIILITVIFAMIFKFVPDVPLQWGDVWIGATLTAALFVVGQLLIGVYLGQAGVGSAYGTAGSFVIILVWVYYSAQIFLFGAEFTKLYAKQHGSHKPAEQAELKQ